MNLFCFGLGYCADYLSAKLIKQGWQVSATCRTSEKAAVLEASGIRPVLLSGKKVTVTDLGKADHILISVPPEQDGSDPVLNFAGAALAALQDQIKWVGYLSTTGVYGDHQGAWIDEETPAGLLSERGQRRVAAEAQWAATGLPMHYFRLAGIYGPGRNSLRALQNGTARRVVKQGQVFSRIHLADITRILEASMANPNAGRAYSVCDDTPAPPQDVVTYAAELMGVSPPALQDFATAELSPMARSFYGENKRIRNNRIKEELGVSLEYPDYRAGLSALWESGTY
ncbi:membrane lipoprotein [Candidatus Micropelagos thuwalensis]|uniref:Membrane lipoprotein n=1 Tax=Candidatus Micropelagius thuwalensis TaxID=1397666 RepID=U2WB53_9PROT|nr:SDR family oxidoreductase [Candidatus Micropelagos thuwalensis]ERL46774.1 membrane lipoprotein [Candidatus Micropelagos thuwalensis]